MSKQRDMERANRRREFATIRSDGTPVGSRTRMWQDGCAEHLTEQGDLFSMTVGGPDHEPGAHVDSNLLLVGRYRFEDPYYADDYHA